MSLSVTATSSTLFITGIPIDATSLTFASSPDGTTYTTLSSVNIQTRTSAYSLTIQTISGYYYRVTIGGGAQNGTIATVQYIVPTKGATGSSTSTFTASGSAIATTNSILLSGIDGIAISDQTYPSGQGLYLQAKLPGAPTVTGTTTYDMVLYDPATGTGTSATTSIYVTVATVSGSSTYTVLYRDSGVATTLIASTALPANPTTFAFYWDGSSNMFVYAGGIQIGVRKFTTTWGSLKALFDVTAYSATASPISITDIRMYPTGSVPTAQTWRLNIQNVTGTSLTNATSPAISTSTYGTYYYITNSGFNALTLPSITSSSDTGAFWVLRNNTSSYLSVTLTGGGSLSSPLVIPPSNGVTIVWSGSAFILF